MLSFLEQPAACSLTPTLWAGGGGSAQPLEVFCRQAVPPGAHPGSTASTHPEVGCTRPMLWDKAWVGSAQLRTRVGAHAATGHCLLSRAWLAGQEKLDLPACPDSRPGDGGPGADGKPRPGFRGLRSDQAPTEAGRAAGTRGLVPWTHAGPTRASPEPALNTPPLRRAGLGGLLKQLPKPMQDPHGSPRTQLHRHASPLQGRLGQPANSLRVTVTVQCYNTET